jgi:ribosomal protein L16/L10AE
MRRGAMKLPVKTKFMMREEEAHGGSE